MNSLTEWLIPLLSFGVFALALLAYVILEFAFDGKGSGELLAVVNTALGSTLGTGAMVNRTRKR